MYSVKLINPMDEGGFHYWTVLFTDSEAVIADLRRDVKFPYGQTEAEMAERLRALLDTVLDEENGRFVNLDGVVAEVDNKGGSTSLWQL